MLKNLGSCQRVLRNVMVRFLLWGDKSAEKHSQMYSRQLALDSIIGDEETRKIRNRMGRATNLSTTLGHLDFISWGDAVWLWEPAGEVWLTLAPTLSGSNQGTSMTDSGETQTDLEFIPRRDMVSFLLHKPRSLMLANTKFWERDIMGGWFGIW